MKISKDKNRQRIAEELLEALGKLDLDRLTLDDYNRFYIGEYLKKPRYNAYMACELVVDLKVDSIDTIIDYGGGIGFNSALFSRLFPEKNILYIDLDPSSVLAAKTLHKSLNINDIEYLVGDIHQLDERLNDRCYLCSRDVIEHIYDLASFFAISRKAKCNVHNTAAILDSLLREKEFKRIHQAAEHYGSLSEHKKERDSRLPYAQQRKTYIGEHYPELSDEALDRATAATRGLICADIDVYLQSGRYPEFHQMSLHDNSCDPHTGNWAERTLSKANYICYAKDLTLQFRYMKYNSMEAKGLKKQVLTALNLLCTLPIHSIQPSFCLVY